MSKVLKFIKGLPFKIAYEVFEPALSPAQLVTVALGAKMIEMGHLWWGLATVCVGGVICSAIWRCITLKIKSPLTETPRND